MKVARDLAAWEESSPVWSAPDGTLEYVCIDVRPYSNGISLHGRYYQRTGGTNREITGIALSDFLLDRAGRHWDGMPMPGLSVSALDHTAIDAYRNKAVIKGRHSESDVAVSDEQVISGLKLIDESLGQRGSLIRAAALMFHPEPDRIVTGATVKIAYFAPEGAYGQNRSDDIIYQDEVRGPLMLQTDRVVDLVYTKYLKALTSFDGLQRIETFMTPKEAFREIILNAINHKRYESGNPIQISVYDDKIIVFNEGHWPHDIDLDDVYTTKHSSYPHNPNLSSVFFNAGEIEAYGGGFARIRMECDAHEAPYPELHITENGVTVIIHACELYMKLLKYGRYWKTYPEYSDNTLDTPESTASLAPDSGNDDIGAGKEHGAANNTILDSKTQTSITRMTETLADCLTEREKKRTMPVYHYLTENDTIDVLTTMQLTGRSRATANRYLVRLVELGILAKEGEARRAVYHRR